MNYVQSIRNKFPKTFFHIFLYIIIAMLLIVIFFSYTQLLAGLLFILSFILFSRTFKAKSKPFEAIKWKPLLANVGGIIVFVLSIKFFGFIISALGFLILYGILSGKMDWKKSVFISTISIVVLYILFIMLLKIPFPNPWL